MFGLVLALALATADPGLAALEGADARVATVAWRLQTSNAELCPVKSTIAGFAVETLGQYQPQARPAVSARIGAGRQPVVQSVVLGGIAERAGLRRGDVLTRINGWPTPRDLPLRASYEATARTQAMIDNALKSPPMMLEAHRGKSVKTLRITGVTGCASRVEIVTGTTLDARADGRNVQISGALVELTTNDDELAIVIAHELAHNILKHAPRPPDTRARGFFSVLQREQGNARLREAELAADRLGVWLFARAGYDIDAVVPFWMKLGQIAADSGSDDGKHPQWNNRIDRIAAAVAEVKSQRALGIPVLPPDRP